MKNMIRNIILTRKLKKAMKWDQLAGFGFLAFTLWLIVQNSDSANTAALQILNSARDSVLSLFRSMGSF